ncbi:hypothetical protein ASC54_00280 [Yonghaparkia sp. Root332]|nr:hypothetical protein ASC54_00280 [Yonghaparkia sp. Root332]
MLAMPIPTSRLRGPRLSSRARLILLPLLAFLVLAGWSYSSPVGSSPDEDYHLASIWCAAGDRTSLCEETGDPATRAVPEAFAVDPCFARFSTESAACQVGAYDEPGLVESDRGNFLGAYPPVFYATMSILASDDVQTSALAMRMLNAALFVGLMTALAVLLPARHRVMAIGSVLISIVPLGMFLIPSLNPSSWAIVGVAVAWLGLIGHLDTTGRRRWLLAGIFALGVLMAAGARADAGIYAVLAIAAALLLRFAPSRAFLVTSILPVGIALLALVATFAAGQLASAAEGFGGAGSQGGAGPAPTVPGGPAAPPAASNGLGLAITNLLNVPSLWAGVLGFWSLGWFDTPLPAVIAFGGVAVFVAVAFTGLAHVDWRKALVFAGAAVALWFIPTWTLTRGGDQVGSEVQPRYLLPLIVLLAGFALLESRGRTLRLSRAQRWLVGLTLAGSQSLSLYVNLRRYLTGDDVKSVNLDSGLEWWWPGVPSPMLLWLLASIAGAALIALLISSWHRAPSVMPVLAPDAPSPVR